MEIPLGSLPVLDKGYVQLLCAAPNGPQLREIRQRMFGGSIRESLADIPRVIIKIRCPYVVLHSMMTTKIRLVHDIAARKDMIYEPKVNEIRSGKHESDVELSDFIGQTLNALIANQTTLQQDGCNGFIAHLTTPIAAYWEGIAYGELSDWIRVCIAPHAPPVIKAYQEAIKTALSTEFLDLDELMRRIKT